MYPFRPFMKCLIISINLPLVLQIDVVNCNKMK
jgi:hypothetical protein